MRFTIIIIIIIIIIMILRSYSTVSIALNHFFNSVNRREDIYLTLPNFYMAYMAHTEILKPRTLYSNLKGQGLAQLIVFS